MAYDERYELNLLRGIEDPRPWDVVSEIKKRLTPQSVVLDIGCGTAYKTIPLAGEVARIVGLEPAAEMLDKARQNIEQAKVTNFALVPGKTEAMPFPDATFDLAVSLLSPVEPSEVYRVLKPGGVLIAELIDNDDKGEIKAFFGQDHDGPRGWFDFYGGRSSLQIIELLRSQFHKVETTKGEWNAHLTREGMILLIQLTHFVRRFDKQADAARLDQVESRFGTEQGIRIVHRRHLVIATK